MNLKTHKLIEVTQAFCSRGIVVVRVLNLGLGTSRANFTTSPTIINGGHDAMKYTTIVSNTHGIVSQSKFYRVHEKVLHKNHLCFFYLSSLRALDFFFLLFN